MEIQLALDLVEKYQPSLSKEVFLNIEERLRAMHRFIDVMKFNSIDHFRRDVHGETMKIADLLSGGNGSHIFYNVHNIICEEMKQFVRISSYYD